MIKTKRGLDLPISGKPEQSIQAGPRLRSVGLLGDDYPGLKPTMLVREGDRVKLGQPLFEDKRNPGVRYTAPAAGTVSAVNRGAKRALRSVVITVDGDEAEAFAPVDPLAASRESVVALLKNSGLWTAFRTRPFSKVPPLDQEPHSIFVTAIDTNPLAGDPAVVLAQHGKTFAAGVQLLTRLTKGKVFVCHRAGASLPPVSGDRISLETFDGPHPAGLPGTHIHFLDPVGPHKTVWFVGYQDVVAFGYLALEGRIWTERVVAIGGPGARKPRLVTTRVGANLSELTQGEAEPDTRIISGSVFAGRTMVEPVDYLGRYHVQVSLLPEDRERRLFGYLSPGAQRHSVLPIYLSKWFGEKNVQFTTSTNGSPRGMVPVGSYERVMPLDILPTQLLRSLLVNDIETAINLGALELDEEDVALCTYACPGKYEYGPVLRGLLSQIEKEG
jgi:Na+-transporting NADH:ubiquinone oxidoreductase subunit A